MSGFPKSWSETIFSDVAEVTDYVANGSFASLKENVTYLEQGYAVLIRLTDWKKNWNGKYVFVSKESYDFLSKSKLEPGDIIISCVGEPGQVFHVPDLGKPMTLGPNSVRLRENPNALHKKYFSYFWKSSIGQKRLEEITSGSTQLKFNKTGLRMTNVVVAPINEQKRIADKLDAVLARVDVCRDHLDRIPALLKRFRQSVLSAAISGKLSEDWRFEQICLTDIEKLTNQVEEFGGSFHEKPWNICSEWKWTNAENVCNFITKGTTPSKEKMTEGSGEVPYIKVYNLTFNGSLDFTISPTYIDEQTHLNELKRSLVYPGDVLMNIVGPPLGKVSIVPADHPEWNINQAIARFRPNEIISSRYLAICLSSTEILFYATRQAKATAGQFNLTLEICRNLPIPLPTLIEQEVIVRRVESLFAYADRLEARYHAARAQVEKLTPSLLAKAFRGELVPQDPNDGPASELLARIASSRSEGKTETTRKASNRKRTQISQATG